MRAQHDPAHVLMPGVHRVASLLKRWLLGTHQGSVGPEHLDAYLNEFTFRFNRAAGGGVACSSTGCLSKPSSPIPSLSQPDRQPPPWRPTANAADAFTRTAGRRATMAHPNLTQIDTPRARIAALRDLPCLLCDEQAPTRPAPQRQCRIRSRARVRPEFVDADGLDDIRQSTSRRC
jgi:hypothetical protein